MPKSCCVGSARGLLFLGAGLLAIVVLTSASGFFGRSPQEGEKRPVGAYMKEINKAMKALEASAGGADAMAGALAAIRDVQAAAFGAKNADPKSAGRIEDAAEKAKFLLEYRKLQVEFLKTALDLEIAVLEGNAAQVKALAEKLESLESDGHEKFKKAKRS